MPATIKFDDWDEIDVIGYHWAVEHANVISGGAQTKALPHDFEFFKSPDEVSPKLFYAFSRGTRFEAVILSLSLQDEGPNFVKFTFKEVYVASFHTTPGGGGQGPTETCGLNFDSVEIDSDVF